MIRTIGPSDTSHVIGLLRLNTPKYFDPSEEEEFVRFLSDHFSTYYVLESEGEILASGGLVFGWNKGKTARIAWDFVHPEHQGKGLGSQLTEYRLKLVRQHKEIERIVVRTSQLAHRYYQRHGFELTSVVPDYWAKGFDLYEMELVTGDG